MAEKKWWENDPLVTETTPTVSKKPWESDPLVNMDAPTDEELQQNAVPQRVPDTSVENMKRVDPETVTQDEAFTIPMGDMDVEQTIQFNRDQGLAEQYKDYQSGPNAGKSLGSKFEPTTDMYEGSQNPDRLYEMAQKQADGTTILGEPTINGKRVPRPGEYDWFGADTPLSISPFKKQNSLAFDAAREGAKNALVTGAAVLDELGVTDKLSDWINRNMADPPKAKKSSDVFIKDALKITAATVAGSKAGLKTGTAISNQKIGTALAGLGGVLAGVAVMNPDDPTLITGKNALFPMLEGTQNEDGTYSGEIVASKLDQLKEAFGLAYPVAKGVQAGAWVADFVNNAVLRPIMYGTPTKTGEIMRQDKVAKDILYHLIGEDNGGSPEKIDKLVAYLKQNKEEVFSFGNKKIPDAVLQRTPMSSINEGATKEGNYLLANKALELEKGGLETGISPLITRREEPVRELDSVLKNTIDASGGKNTVETFRQLLADQAISKLDEAGNIRRVAEDKASSNLTEMRSKLDDRVTQAELEGAANVEVAEGNLDEINSGLEELYKSDTTFAQTIDQLSKDSGIDVANKFKTGETKKLLPEIVNSVKAVEEKKNALYDLPEGVEVDIDSFKAVVGDAIEAGHLSAKLNKAIADKVPHILDDSISETVDDFGMSTFERNLRKEVDDWKGKSPDNISQRKKVDFRILQKDILPKINAAISEEYFKGVNARTDVLDSLKAIRDNINEDQVEFVLDNADTEIVEQMLQAKKYYVETYVRYAKDHKTPIGQLFDSYHEVRGKLDDYTDSEGNILSLGNNYHLTDKAQNVIEKGVTDDKLGSSQQIIDFMSNPDYKGDSKGLLKVYKGEVAGAIADQIASGKTLEDIDPALIYKTLKDKGVVLKENFPEETKQIEDFITKFKTAKMSQKQATEALDLVRKEADQTIASVKAENKDIFSGYKDQVKLETKASKKEAKVLETEVKKGALNKFIETGPDGPIPKQNGYNIFKGMLNKAGNENRINEITKRVRDAKDPEAQKGLESAYFTMIQDIYKSASNAKRVNPASAKKIFDENGSIQKYGEIIFGNYTDPKEKEASLNTLKVYNKFLEEVFREQAKVSDTSIPLGQQIGVQKEAQSAFGYLTRFVFGALSRTGTMVTSTGGRVIKYTDPDTHAKEIRAKILSDPEFAEEAFLKIKNKLSSGLTKEEANALRQAGVTISIMEGEKSGEKFKEKYLKTSLPDGVR